MRPHWWQPTRLPRPWDSPGKNTGVGSHFLLQCMKVKSESEVAQPCPTLSDPMDRSLPGSAVHGIFPGKSTGVGCHCLLWIFCYCSIISILAFAVHWSESAICIHMPPSSWTSPHLPSPLGHHRALSWAPCAIQQLPLAIHLTRDSVCMLMLLSQFVPSSSSPTVSICSFFMPVSLFLSAN